jgi:hypothetical protein
MPHLLLSLIVFSFAIQGLGYRALWQDEVETAERARTVLESGVPRIIDRSGDLSVNWGGYELDQGPVHRYNTWGQFYVGAVGLAIGHVFGFEPDAAVRSPFVAAHAATAGLVSFGLSAFVGASLPVSVAAGAAVAIQTPRLVHNRTARYHALLDVLVVVALVALGAWRQGYPWAPWVFAVTLFALPHVHIFGGGVLVLGLSVLGLHVSVARALPSWRAGFRDTVLYIGVPGMLSLIALVLLVRPWRYGAMGGSLQIEASKLLSFHTVANIRHLAYAGGGIVMGLALLAYLKRWGAALSLAGATIVVVMAIRVLDFNVLTQSWAVRYYLAAPLLALFWAIAVGVDELQRSMRNALALAMCALALLPELPSPSGHTAFEPLWGAQLVVSDRDHAAAADKQPLHRAVEMIRTRAQPGDSIAADYVPQFVTWYLPGHPPALVPDPVGRHAANRDNPVWTRAIEFPRWHLRYSQWPNGTWFCAPNCDYHSSGDPRRGHYQLTSKTLKRTETFCVHGVWPTNPWNNSPPLNYQRAALTPEGTVDGVLILGGPCSASAETHSTRLRDRESSASHRNAPSILRP